MVLQLQGGEGELNLYAEAEWIKGLHLNLLNL